MTIVRTLFRFVKKVPIRGAFFIGLLLLTACANSEQSSELFHVKTVVDGDTLTLSNGEIVRFVGINTPELGHGKFRDEPLANSAKRFVEKKVEGRDIRLIEGNQTKDRHGRLLAHVLTKDGDNIQVQLLERGLAFAIAVGDNTVFLDEYLSAEKIARDGKKGVWSDDFYKPIAAKKAVDEKLKGFRRIIGEVERVSRSKKNQILHLRGGFRLLIGRDYWKKNFKGKAKRYVGEKVIARGWMFKSHGIVGMKVYHPYMVVIQ